MNLLSLLVRGCCWLLLLGVSAQTAVGQAQQVITGIHLMNIYNLDINQHSFYADFYIWFKWKGDRDPTDIEFVNAVEKWGFTRKLFYEEAPKRLADGYFYNGMRIEGRFYHPFELTDFPLDQHQLDIQVENALYPLDSLVYVPDTEKSLVREHFSMPGWEIQKSSIINTTNQYRTNFGETGAEASSFSNFTFSISIARPVNYFLLKLLLPLLIVLAVGFGSLFIHPTNMDGRVSLSIGSLLAIVFLQQSYSDALPDVGYMVLMDKIYLLAYVLITAVMLRVVRVGNWIAHAVESHHIPLMLRKDRFFVLVFLVLMLVGILFFVF